MTTTQSNMIRYKLLHQLIPKKHSRKYPWKLFIQCLDIKKYVDPYSTHTINIQTHEYKT